MAFEPPSEKTRLEAIGNTSKLSKKEQAAFNPIGFEPIGEPDFGDWLFTQDEPGQTFYRFLKAGPPRPDATRSVLYLLPLEKFKPDPALPSMDELKRYLELFCSMKVKVLSPANLNEMGIRSRIHHPKLKSELGPQSRRLGSKTFQYRAGDVLKFLKYNLPPDAFAMLGVTYVDLYPDESWEFCFGQSSLKARVGVYSFARFDPLFYGLKRQRDIKDLMLKRCITTMTHETCHLFGIDHCIYYDCLMNGSNSIEEKDELPLHLCPCDLRKLSTGVPNFDVVARYKALSDYYSQKGMQLEAAWTKRQIEKIKAAR